MSKGGSDFNMQKITTQELSDNLRATVEFGGNAFICGQRGSGKTMIAKDIIPLSGCKEVYLNMSTLERADFAGYPNFFGSKERKYVDFLLPAFFELLMEGNDPVVALLDEVDKAESSLWAPLLEFTQFHTMNGRKLPNLKAIIMTGNLPSEGGQRPCLPLLDRAEKYILEASSTQWLDWAAKSGQIHPSVAAYIADHPDDLFGETDPGDIYADPSPRGWHNASKILFFGEENKWGNKILTNKVSGCIGKKAGMKYSAYFDHYRVLLPIVERIMEGKKIDGFRDLEQTKQMVASMIVCARVARILDEMKPKAAFPEAISNVAGFLKSVDPEMALISVRSQIGLDRMINKGLDDQTEWDEILKSIASRISMP